MMAAEVVEAGVVEVVVVVGKGVVVGASGWGKQKVHHKHMMGPAKGGVQK